MAKFIVGVLVGLFLGATVSAYGASASRSGTLLGWAVANIGIDACFGPNATETCDQ
jgi:hypothetical protein